MKSITNRLFVFAATAVFLGTTAFGQTTMRADVPFAFHVTGRRSGCRQLSLSTWITAGLERS